MLSKKFSYDSVRNVVKCLRKYFDSNLIVLLNRPFINPNVKSLAKEIRKYEEVVLFLTKKDQNIYSTEFPESWNLKANRIFTYRGEKDPEYGEDFLKYSMRLSGLEH